MRLAGARLQVSTTASPNRGNPFLPDVARQFEVWVGDWEGAPDALNGKVPVREGLDRDPRALDGPLLRARLGVLLHRPVSSYAQLVGAGADADTFFIGSVLFTAGGAFQTWIAFLNVIAVSADAGLVGGHDPVHPPSVLQRHDLSALQTSITNSTTTGSSGAPTRSARSAS